MPTRGILYRNSDENPKIEDLRKRYEKRGGNFNFLWMLAQQALPVSPPLSRNMRACFRRLERYLPRLIQWPDLHPELRAPLEGALIEVSLKLASSANPPSRQARRRRRAGRPPGTSRVNLVMATMAEEFRRRFGGPCYADILTLIQDINPDVLYMTADPKEALRQRILSVPIAQVRKYHKYFSRVFRSMLQRSKTA